MNEYEWWRFLKHYLQVWQQGDAHGSCNSFRCSRWCWCISWKRHLSEHRFRWNWNIDYKPLIVAPGRSPVLIRKTSVQRIRHRSCLEANHDTVSLLPLYSCITLVYTCVMSGPEWIRRLEMPSIGFPSKTDLIPMLNALSSSTQTILTTWHTSWSFMLWSA